MTTARAHPNRGIPFKMVTERASKIYMRREEKKNFGDRRYDRLSACAWYVDYMRVGRATMMVLSSSIQSSFRRRHRRGFEAAKFLRRPRRNNHDDESKRKKIIQ